MTLWGLLSLPPPPQEKKNVVDKQVFSFITKYQVMRYLFYFIFLGPTSSWMVTLQTGRRKVPGSNPSRACRPSRSEFSMVFSETRVNTGLDCLEKPSRRAFHLQSQVPQADNWTQTCNHFFLRGGERMISNASFF